MMKSKFMKYTMIMTGIFMAVNLVLLYNFFKLIIIL